MPIDWPDLLGGGSIRFYAKSCRCTHAGAKPSRQTGISASDDADAAGDGFYRGIMLSTISVKFKTNGAPKCTFQIRLTRPPR